MYYSLIVGWSLRIYARKMHLSSWLIRQQLIHILCCGTNFWHTSRDSLWSLPNRNICCHFMLTRPRGRRRKSDPRHEESKAADQADTALCKPRVDLGLIHIIWMLSGPNHLQIMPYPTGLLDGNCCSYLSIFPVAKRGVDEINSR